MGLDKKIDALMALRPDLAIIQECSLDSIERFGPGAISHEWVGDKRTKGLAVIGFGKYRVKAISDPKYRWVLPLKVSGPATFNLLAVWACKSTNGLEDYIGQVYLAIKKYEPLMRRGSWIVAGDLNSNTIWDKKHRLGNHSEVVRVLAERKLVSVYHERSGEPQGKESQKTFYQYRRLRRTYHIDYCFAPANWLSNSLKVEVGKPKYWLNFSDHCPLIVDF